MYQALTTELKKVIKYDIYHSCDSILSHAQIYTFRGSFDENVRERGLEVVA